MIDIHSHILNNVDDGSKSFLETVEILKLLPNVSKVILTPHLFKLKNGLSKEEIEKSFVNFKKNIINYTDIKFYLGSEVYYTKDIKRKILNNEIITLNNSNYILLEFSSINEEEVEDVIYHIKLLGYKVVLAHVERYKYLTIEDISVIKENGSLIQVNASSFFNKYNKLVKKLMKKNLIDFIASDIHSIKDIENYNDAYNYVKKKYGEKKALELFEENQNIFF